MTLGFSQWQKLWRMMLIMAIPRKALHCDLLNRSFPFSTVMIDAEIPFAFTIDNVRFVDTTDLNLKIDAPEQIEKLTLELTFTSTVPLGLNAQFFTYDSELGQVTDALVAKDRLINASYDGRPVTTELTLEVTGETIKHLNHSDRLISVYEIDTDARDVCLKSEQQLGVFIKARVKYKDDIGF